MNENRTYRTDDTIPMETVIYFSKIKIVLYLLVCVSFSVLIIPDLWSQPKLKFKFILSGLGSVLFLWGAIGFFKQLLNIHKPQLIISNKGIWCAENADEGVHLWSNINEEHIMFGTNYQISIGYNYQNKEIFCEGLEAYKKSLPQLAKIPKQVLDNLIETLREMEDIHPAWEQYGISDENVEHLAEIYDYSNKYVELDILSYNISRKQLQYLLEIYRGRHLQAQKTQ